MPTADDLGALIGLGLDADRARLRLLRDAEGSETTLVADVESVVRGVLSIRWSGGCDKDCPWLYGAEVETRFRNAGIGSALWIAAERLALERGASEVSLDVEVSNNAARRLYERLGCEVLGPHLHHWRAIDPDTRQVTSEGASETLAMRKRLVGE